MFFYIFSIFIELALGRNHQREKRNANTPPQMQMPYTQNPYNNYQPDMAGTGPYNQQQRPGGFFGRVFGRNRGGQQAVPQYDPNSLPEHTHPRQMDNNLHNNRDSEATIVGGLLNQESHNKYETGYGNVSPAPRAHSPMVAGYTNTTGGDAAAYTYTHPGESYTHSGDHYGHAGDDYHRNNNGAHQANTAATLPYPADNPYDRTTYDQNNRPTQPQQPTRYPTQGHHYDDGIYDRP
ncbi:hypothetical protein NQ176_g8622 [Zarea fungicola]|uniref:Uncharacterized protein n=1 Tax=Zarea fungicola TaxID=93591 RepID=A0ACC1MRC1_9HYPO|nr:hypothetical protein NQ176_g8622 [Lecanicillium fungicola]